MKTRNQKSQSQQQEYELIQLGRFKSSQIVFIALFTSVLALFVMVIVLIEIEDNPRDRNYQKLVKVIYDDVLAYKKAEGLDWLLVENTVSKGVKITFDASLFTEQSLFTSARAKLNPFFLPYINRLTSLIAHLDLANISEKHSSMVTKILQPNEQLLMTVRIEGHSDSTPLAATALYQNNIELSSFRAYSIMRMIMLYSKVPAENLSISGYGCFKPLVADTENPINRRVEIYIVPQIMPSNERFK